MLIIKGNSVINLENINMFQKLDNSLFQKQNTIRFHHPVDEYIDLSFKNEKSRDDAFRKIIAAYEENYRCFDIEE